jgi:hypothetical protein
LKPDDFPLLIEIPMIFPIDHHATNFFYSQDGAACTFRDFVYLTGLSQMKIELDTSAAAEPSRASIGQRPHQLVEGNAAETWRERRAGGPIRCPDGPYDPLHGPSASSHGARSPTFSAQRPSPHFTAHDHPGLGAARSRPIRPRIAAKNVRGAAPSASWNVIARVMHDIRSDLDQPLPQRRQHPSPDRAGLRPLPQEVPQVAGQGEQREPRLIIPEPAARQPRPLQRVLALLDRKHSMAR